MLTRRNDYELLTRKEGRKDKGAIILAYFLWKD
jgi:hypothetical protein